MPPKPRRRRKRTGRAVSDSAPAEGIPSVPSGAGLEESRSEQRGQPGVQATPQPPNAGDTCVVLASQLEVFRVDAAIDARPTFLEQGDVVVLTDVRRSSGGTRVVHFDLSDGSQAWTFWTATSELGMGAQMEVIDTDTARQLMDKILSAADAEFELHSSTQAPDNVQTERLDDSESQGALSRQLSVHGPDYDTLLERGMPRRMLRKAWLMGGPSARQAMEFIRANFDQPDEFWDIAGQGQQFAASAAVDTSASGLRRSSSTAELQRQSSSSVRPTIDALRRLGSTDSLATGLRTLLDTLDSEEKEVLKRLEAKGILVFPDSLSAPSLSMESVGTITSPPQKLNGNVQRDRDDPNDDTQQRNMVTGSKAASPLDPESWNATIAVQPAFDKLSDLAAVAESTQLPSGANDENRWMKSIKEGSIVEVNLAALQDEVNALLRSAQQETDEAWPTVMTVSEHRQRIARQRRAALGDLMEDESRRVQMEAELRRNFSAQATVANQSEQTSQSDAEPPPRTSSEGKTQTPPADWVRAEVVSVEKRERLSERPSLLRGDERSDERSKSLCRSSYCTGDRVAIFSKSMGAWCEGRVQITDKVAHAVTVEYRGAGGALMQKVLMQNSADLKHLNPRATRRDKAEDTASRQGIGEMVVEAASSSHPSSTQSLDDKAGADCQPASDTTHEQQELGDCGWFQLRPSWYPSACLFQQNNDDSLIHGEFCEWQVVQAQPLLQDPNWLRLTDETGWIQRCVPAPSVSFSVLVEESDTVSSAQGMATEPEPEVDSESEPQLMEPASWQQHEEILEASSIRIIDLAYGSVTDGAVFYIIEVQSDAGIVWTIMKRYSMFNKLRTDLIKTLTWDDGRQKLAEFSFPAKQRFGGGVFESSPKLTDQRTTGLEGWMNNVLAYSKDAEAQQHCKEAFKAISMFLQPTSTVGAGAPKLSGICEVEFQDGILTWFAADQYSTPLGSVSFKHILGLEERPGNREIVQHSTATPDTMRDPTSTFQWYSEQRHAWIDYATSIQEKLMTTAAALHTDTEHRLSSRSKTQVHCQIRNQSYIIDLVGMTQTNCVTGVVTQLRKVDCNSGAARYTLLDPVKVYSKHAATWCDGFVKNIDGRNGILHVDYKSPNGAMMQKALMLNSPDVKPDTEQKGRQRPPTDVHSTTDMWCRSGRCTRVVLSEQDTALTITYEATKVDSTNDEGGSTAPAGIDSDGGVLNAQSVTRQITMRLTEHSHRKAGAVFKHLSDYCTTVADRYAQLHAQMQSVQVDGNAVQSTTPSCSRTLASWHPVPPPRWIMSVRLRLPMESRVALNEHLDRIRSQTQATELNAIERVIRRVVRTTSSTNRRYAPYYSDNPQTLQPEITLHTGLCNFLRQERTPWAESLVPGEEVELLVANRYDGDDPSWMVATVAAVGPPLRSELSKLPILRLSISDLDERTCGESQDQFHRDQWQVHENITWDEYQRASRVNQTNSRAEEAVPVLSAAEPEPEPDIESDDTRVPEFRDGTLVQYQGYTGVTVEAYDVHTGLYTVHIPGIGDRPRILERELSYENFRRHRVPRNNFSSRLAERFQPKVVRLADFAFRPPYDGNGAVLVLVPNGDQSSTVCCFVNVATMLGQYSARLSDKCADLANDEPHVLVGTTIEFSNSVSLRPLAGMHALVLSYAKELQKWVLQASQSDSDDDGMSTQSDSSDESEFSASSDDGEWELDSEGTAASGKGPLVDATSQNSPPHLDEGRELRGVYMVDLRRHRFLTHGTCIHVETTSLIAPVGTHLLQCLTCLEPTEPADFAEFCYREYRVTGDSERKRDPRHCLAVCNSCFRRYVDSELATAQLFVKCPCCPRALQTRELRQIAKPKLYAGLVARIAAAEQAHVDPEALAMASKLGLRRCPNCSTIIEKNAGCSSMNCYMCGSRFTWQAAEPVTAPQTQRDSSTLSAQNDPHTHPEDSWEPTVGFHPNVERVVPAESAGDENCVLM